jgi:hypothetical protein
METSQVSGHSSKVFGIGLSRTGTTSLHHALQMLGLESAPTSVSLMDLLDDATAPADVLDTATAFTDNPIPFLYPLLDRLRPGSKFILTTRPLDEWLASMEWLFGEGLRRLDRKTRALGNEVHEQLYGITNFDASVLSRVFETHHRGVSAYFEDRTDDLLLMRVTDFAWPELCAFVGVEVPATSFPHKNHSGPSPRSFSRLFRKF